MARVYSSSVRRRLPRTSTDGVNVGRSGSPLKPHQTTSVVAVLVAVVVTTVAHVAELIALCKASPGKYSFASSGPGSSLHLSGELFKVMAGVDILHIPYKGAGPPNNDVISGTVTMMFANMPSMLPQVKAAS